MCFDGFTRERDANRIVSTARLSRLRLTDFFSEPGHVFLLPVRRPSCNQQQALHRVFIWYAVY